MNTTLNQRFLNIIKNNKFIILLLLSSILGIATGIIFGEKAKILTPLGKIFINLTFTIIIPTIFFIVSSCIVNIISLKSAKKIICKSFIVFLFMSIISAIFMLFVMKFFHSDFSINIPLFENKKIVESTLWENVPNIFTVNDFYKIFSKDAILPLIIFSLLFSLAVRLMGKKAENIKHGLNIGKEIMFKMVNFLMYYAPIAFFSLFASVFSGIEQELLMPAFKLICVFYIASFIFCFVFYTFLIYISTGKDGLKTLKYLLIPTAFGFVTRSSLAALPSSFESAEKINVPKSVSALTLSLGSIFHLDGSSAAAVFKIVILFLIFDMPLTGFDFYFGIVLFSVFISFFSSGIPGSGFILEISLLMFYGFPLQLLPFLLVVNTAIDPIVTLLNVSGNIVATMVVSRMEKGKGWIFKKELEEDTVLKIYK